MRLKAVIRSPPKIPGEAGPSAVLAESHRPCCGDGSPPTLSWDGNRRTPEEEGEHRCIGGPTAGITSNEISIILAIVAQPLLSTSPSTSTPIHTPPAPSPPNHPASPRTCCSCRSRAACCPRRKMCLPCLSMALSISSI